ncbi:MAG: hypothetical protein KAS62_09445 [Candidatus Delongbacteria bacterium]|nr:hypothetical protein [Candidatus Delongbacteria bacterium]
MKKHFVITLLVITISLFSQFEITKHKVYPSIGTGYMINAERFTGNSLMNIAIPYGSYKLEGRTDEKSMYYLYANGGFCMNKFASADELPIGELPGSSTNDSFAYNMELFVNPMIKYFMKDSTFATIGLPFSFVSKPIDLSPDEADMVISSDLQFNITSAFGYDTRDIEFHILSPWDKFEEGMAAYGFLNYGLFKHYTYSGITDEQDKLLSEAENIFGIEGCYSYLLEDQKLLLKPIARYEMQFNDVIDEYWWFTTKVFAAWDYTKKINVNGTVGIKYGDAGKEKIILRNHLEGGTTWFMIETEINYYIKPELKVFFGFEGESLLFAIQEDDDWQRNASELNIRLGATYQLNFVNEY